jgi:hypothetical protein
MVVSINITIGFTVTATTGVLGISDPFLWGTLAAVLSFAPLRWRVCDRHSIISGRHSDFRQPRPGFRGSRSLFRADDDLLAGRRPFCGWSTNDTQSGSRIYRDHRARLDVGSYRRFGCRSGARELEDYLRTHWAVASGCRVLEPLGGAFRLHGNKLLYGEHFAVDEEISCRATG